MIQFGRNPEHPLDGLKVVDFSTVIAAPTCGRFLADLGADVIKVEGITGDPVREQSFGTPKDPDEHPIFSYANSNKKLISVNMKDPEGYEIMMGLLKDADVFLSNVRYASIERLGLSYDVLHEKFPRLVYGHFSGYGYNGPDAALGGYDVTAFWSRSGMLHDWVPEGGGDILIDPQYAAGDVISTMAMYSAILTALYAREQTGKGTMAVASLQHTGIWANNGAYITRQYGYKIPRVIEELNPFLSAYKCQDGKEVFLGFISSAKYPYEKQCEIFEIPQFKDDERAKKPDAFDKDPQLCREVRSALEKSMKNHPREYWADLFRKLDMPFGLIERCDDVVKDQNAWDNNYLEELEFKNGHKLAMSTVPMKFTEYSVKKITPSREVGSDTDMILKERLGYTDEQLKALREKKAIR